jgi:hypothetical protein
MKRRIMIAGLFIACISSFSPLPAGAYFEGITIDNRSDKCAWITIYTSAVHLSWTPVPGSSRVLKAGEHSSWQLPGAYEIKAGAEVKSGPGCSGPNIEHTYDVRKKSPFARPESLTAHLQLAGGKYRIWFI